MTMNELMWEYDSNMAFLAYWFFIQHNDISVWKSSFKKYIRYETWDMEL